MKDFILKRRNMVKEYQIMVMEKFIRENFSKIWLKIKKYSISLIRVYERDMKITRMKGKDKIIWPDGRCFEGRFK